VKVFGDDFEIFFLLTGKVAKEETALAGVSADHCLETQGGAYFRECLLFNTESQRIIKFS
jgi:hypothetical protein